MLTLTAALGTAIAAGAGRAPAADCRHLPAPPATAAAPNDNRAGAGVLRDGVLTVRLVARAAAWRPDGPAGCALSVRAFAEEGRPTRIPGPMIRVRSGTEVRVSVRNALGTALWLRGLQGRDAHVLDSAEVAPGATREFRFVATAPGAWYYWAGAVGDRVPVSGVDGQLVGALVVDPREGPAAPDRVLVLTRWTPAGTPGNEGFQVNAINGRSWPNTERLAYTVGDSVRWQVVNASDGLHEMHLHGFFFRMDARGYALDSATVRDLSAFGRMRVTAVMRPGEWLSMAWSPDRPGNWLYHCHLLTHMSAAQRLDRAPGAAAPADRGHGATGNHAHDDMAGLVLGLAVAPPGRAAAVAVRHSPAGERALALYASARPRVFGERPGYGFVVQDGPLPPAPDSIRIPGTPLVLTRGAPVRIAVHNRLSLPISVHWHGIELESYFDGVGGFSGAGRRVAPTIAPNDSFVVRMTPPRAGTYMYHVHGESGDELRSGLYGPLIVVDPDAPFDPRAERVLVLADGGPGSAKPVAVNGSAAPDTMHLTVGTTYRLRLAYISANDVINVALRGPDGPVPARVVAVDGYPSAQSAPARPLQTRAGPGHTQDFVFTPTAPGDYVLTALRTADAAHAERATVVPIRVRAP
jgi:FtsP/CotA-like multicopper oxidase with cupredoxin domain